MKPAHSLGQLCHAGWALPGLETRGEGWTLLGWLSSVREPLGSTRKRGGHLPVRTRGEGRLYRGVGSRPWLQWV